MDERSWRKYKIMHLVLWVIIKISLCFQFYQLAPFVFYNYEINTHVQILYFLYCNYITKEKTKKKKNHPKRDEVWRGWRATYYLSLRGWKGPVAAPPSSQSFERWTSTQTIYLMTKKGSRLNRVNPQNKGREGWDL
jgi:hypothetical protein